MRRERAEKLFNLLGEIDDKIIEEADIVRSKSAQIVQMGRKKGMVRFVTLAASVAFLVVGIWGLGQFGMESDDKAMDVADDWDDEFVLEFESDDWDDDMAADEADEADDDWVGESEETLNDRRVDFVHELTEEQLSAVFPGLDAEIFATALFLDDGTLVEVEGIIQMLTGEQMLIRVAEGEIQHTVIDVPDATVAYTIHGVVVTVYDEESASFMLDNIAYYVEFYDGFNEEIVSQIILGGPADLSVFSEVVIP